MSTDRFVKLGVGYYRDPKVAGLDDAGEVMFSRALAYCGEQRTGGHVPDEILATLTRRPTQARRIADRIVSKGAWVRVAGGYQIVRWEDWQDALDALERRRQSDRERKRVKRATARGVHGLSADTSAEVRTTDKEEEKEKNAAAAASADTDLPPAVEILRSRLEQHLLFVRWDTLTDDQLTEIVALVERHGDALLVKTALNAYQPAAPAVYATAWLGHWREIRDRPLTVIRGRCDTHNQDQPCRACASDAKVTGITT